MTNEPVWTEWLENPGTGECPVPKWHEDFYFLFESGQESGEPAVPADEFDWRSERDPETRITHYRYAVPADLAALAQKHNDIPSGCDVISLDENGKVWTRDRLLRARRDLGYEKASGIEAEPGEGDYWEQEFKQHRYRDHSGEDWIDEFARTATPEEFRGAMRFTIGKYNRRAGKKDDLVKEIRKMRGYCDRWLEYEGDV